MPTYEYRCNGCKREFEAVQKMADPDLTHCTSCHQEKLEKLISFTLVKSDVWKEALYKDNAKHEIKGTHPVDTSKPPKSTAQPTTIDDSFVPCSEACATSAAAERATR